VIGSLRGRLGAVLGAGEVLVDVGGVGYRVQVTPSTVGALEAAGSGAEVFLHVHTHVREDALVLYGFQQAEERRCFEALLGAHGVGPALALAVLAVLGPDALRRAVLEDDIAMLSSVPGIGKKTAMRLVIDLKSRLEVPERDLVAAGGTERASTARAEVRAALGELGYSPEEVRRAMEGVREELAVEELLRRVLQELAVR